MTDRTKLSDNSFGLRPIDSLDAAILLARNAVTVGGWNQLESKVELEVRRVDPPTDSALLWAFSLNILDWLRPNTWSLFQIENSNCLLPSELAVSNAAARLPRAASFETPGSYGVVTAEQMPAGFWTGLAGTIFWLIAFEGHVGITGDTASDKLRMIRIIEGEVYFCYQDASDCPSTLLQIIAGVDATYPEWSGEGNDFRP